ncbi:MAG: Asp-tRNA(Asn)/Glu-tRNA(Gln) amidotransferase GatCAB subunit B, partial [Lachnospiraceae bacterium]|nr:Asp-tRNA(Asn)/Glu-tRNA(Gln) amidotransferase GatCAB subunit B [Lachnospiraceae bacterium]
IEILTGEKALADLFEAAAAICGKPKQVSNWLMGETLRLCREKNRDVSDLRFSPENLAKLIDLTEQKAINGSVAKEVFEVMFEENVDPVSYVEEKGLKTVGDEGLLRKAVEEVLQNNPQSVSDYKGGKQKALGFLVGQTMKAMKGKVDPAMVNRLLKEALDQV